MTAGAALKFGPSISVKLEAAVGEGDCVKCELLFALRNIYATPLVASLTKNVTNHGHKIADRRNSVMQETPNQPWRCPLLFSSNSLAFLLLLFLACLELSSLLLSLSLTLSLPPLANMIVVVMVDASRVVDLKGRVGMVVPLMLPLLSVSVAASTLRVASRDLVVILDVFFFPSSNVSNVLLNSTTSPFFLEEVAGVVAGAMVDDCVAACAE